MPSCARKKLRYWPASDGAAGSGRLDQNLGMVLQDSYPTSGPYKMTTRTDLITMQRILKRCCTAGLVLLVFIGLGPANWQPRSGLGWEIDHFVGYFVITLVFCIAWPRPFVVAGALIVFAAVLETLQALTPDRWANPWAAFYSACGVLVAALIADVSIRAWTRFQSKRAQKPSL
jgi:hypothetical protein